ncbi:hypothetical protein HRR83_004786 [Exophiala dermatitidis]|uniref:Uncharacterized protein n=2 Tax=Exophiala dermatitidis TaxID=5970 RepID=H6BS79_EXODN|nr:uncharacterized protein HMPREF1120_02309 [Exophiala dermatitidis NIH/UT8656]KAJ4544349.1 hypothetical protein HRR76_002413 [Exophiala dermatitidis]EHY54134.1 hypothetical protein HMPREF1120_02309 [Exophiala dermatitidis NIH/UT8656]KAJ4557946.1 hypothetical protein HRR78_001621 [Exophiala dermatitidis]KAJ4561768.1 hypothetical protein HRR79_007103 [Exophiala dermatitidis]KAJ4572572.1 hypothetical protein HRR82_006979 [Exophiala dermatitidis]
MSFLADPDALNTEPGGITTTRLQVLSRLGLPITEDARAAMLKQLPPPPKAVAPAPEDTIESDYKAPDIVATPTKARV